MTDMALALSEDAVEAIAQRVVELLSTARVVSGADAGHLVDVADVARKYDVSPSWVYDHADELGVIRLGTGAKPRLRFDLDKVSQAMPSCSTSRRSGSPASPSAKPTSRSRPRRSMGTSTELLPIRGLREPVSPFRRDKSQPRGEPEDE